MTEYFNVYDESYVEVLRKSNRRYLLRLVFLTFYETPVCELTAELSINANGQISVNNQQLTRRSCSLSLINVDKRFTPSPNGYVWSGRKFKLYTGVSDLTRTFFFENGVFVIQNASVDNGTVSIEAVDKGGLLDGTLKHNMLETKYVIAAGSNIHSLIYSALQLPYIAEESGATPTGYMPVDPKEPLIDISFRNAVTQSEITIDTNNHLGELFTKLADDYGADVYYNTDGRLVFKPSVNNSKVGEWRYMAHSWDYSDSDSFYCARSLSYSFDGANTVTVYTNAASTDKNQNNVSYTASNNNPKSPLRTGLVGVKRMSGQEVKFIAGLSETQMKSKCQQYADFLLMRESFFGMQLGFKSPIIPHLDVNKTIGITDSTSGLDAATFVIQSITLPLYAGEMDISATDTNWLPDNTYIEGIGG